MSNKTNRNEHSLTRIELYLKSMNGKLGTMERVICHNEDEIVGNYSSAEDSIDYEVTS